MFGTGSRLLAVCLVACLAEWHSRGHANGCKGHGRFNQHTRSFWDVLCNALTAANLFRLFVGGTIFPLTARIAHLVSLHSIAALLTLLTLLTYHEVTIHTLSFCTLAPLPPLYNRPSSSNYPSILLLHPSFFGSSPAGLGACVTSWMKQQLDASAG